MQGIYDQYEHDVTIKMTNGRFCDQKFVHGNYSDHSHHNDNIAKTEQQINTG